MRELRHNETRNKLEITKRAVMERTPDPGSILAEPVILHTRGCCLQLHFGPGPANDIPKVPGPLLLHLLHEGIRMRASDSDVQQTADHRAFALANGRLITQLTFPPFCIPFPSKGLSDFWERSQDSRELDGTTELFYVFPGGSDGKASACYVGDLGLIPGLGRSPGEGNDNPLQYPCLENPMDRGTW